ncbi:MAG: diacylglycerol/lipid kinase family protein [Actinomycetota bacterium]
MKLLLVTNPSSGSASKHDREALLRALSPLGEIEAIEPASLDDFASEVLAAARGRDLVVSAGGDGTLNCTVNALEGVLDEVTLALLPLGTGNDLARTLGLQEDPLEVARGLVEGRPIELDVGRASGQGAERLFVNACMGGFPVQVNEALEAEEKERLGAAAFLWGGVKALSDLDRSTVRLQDRDVPNCVAAGVGNGRTAGGGIEIWPDADPTDGLLDACALPAAGPADLVKLGTSLKLGDHRQIPEVFTTRGASIRIESTPDIEINVDGELVGLKTPATFEVFTKARVLVPGAAAS